MSPSSHAEQRLAPPSTPSPRNPAAVFAGALIAVVLFAGQQPLQANISIPAPAARQQLTPAPRLAPVSGESAADQRAGGKYRQWTGDAAGAAPFTAAILFFGFLPSGGAVAPVAATAAPTPAETPDSAPAASVPDVADEARVLAETWARAWSERDVEHYLAAYGRDFAPDQGISREAWEQSRRHKIENRKSIAVTLRDLKVDAAGADRLEVRFLQDYAADNFHEMGTPKLLVLGREDGTWRIVAEAVESVQAARE